MLGTQYEHAGAPDDGPCPSCEVVRLRAELAALEAARLKSHREANEWCEKTLAAERDLATAREELTAVTEERENALDMLERERDGWQHDPRTKQMDVEIQGAMEDKARAEAALADLRRRTIDQNLVFTRELERARALLARAPETLDAQWDDDRRAFLRDPRRAAECTCWVAGYTGKFKPMHTELCPARDEPRRCTCGRTESGVSIHAITCPARDEARRCTDEDEDCDHTPCCFTERGGTGA